MLVGHPPLKLEYLVLLGFIANFILLFASKYAEENDDKL